MSAFSKREHASPSRRRRIYQICRAMTHGRGKSLPYRYLALESVGRGLAPADPKNANIPGRNTLPGMCCFFTAYTGYPARISNFSTPSAEPTRAIMASSSSLISLVSALMVTPAQPLVGMVWLMVSIFAPELAKIDR